MRIRGKKPWALIGRKIVRFKSQEDFDRWSDDDVTLTAHFAPDGSFLKAENISGPEMLKTVAEQYVGSWQVNADATERVCEIRLAFQIPGGLNCTEPFNWPASTVTMTDLQHFEIFRGPAGYCEDLSLPQVQHHFLFFHWNKKLKLNNLVKTSKV